jgi:aspartyl-tRNA(Asn)/glutamyl-tRNA(Gln) amidotransferase subunit A
MALHTMTMAELTAGLESGGFTSVDVTRSLLDRIASHDAKLNALITVTGDAALAAAAKADGDRAAGNAGVLNGLPIIHKDIFCTRGVKTSCGSKMLDNFVSPYDATVVERLSAAGAVVLGKANMDEFAMGSSNETSFYGPVHNPWDLDCSPGGSSGASARSADQYRWYQADLWQGLALRHDRVRVQPRSGWDHYAHRRRRGAGAWRYGRLR